MNEPAGTTRPKIHRLPPPNAKGSELYLSRTVVIVCVALMLVVVVPALWSYSKSSSTKPTPQAQSHTPQAPAADSETIAVHDEKGEMVGELAKMPADLERGSSINTTSKVDPDSGKELLSIIGKY